MRSVLLRWRALPAVVSGEVDLCAFRLGLCFPRFLVSFCGVRLPLRGVLPVGYVWATLAHSSHAERYVPLSPSWPLGLCTWAVAQKPFSGIMGPSLEGSLPKLGDLLLANAEASSQPQQDRQPPALRLETHVAQPGQPLLPMEGARLAKLHTLAVRGALAWIWRGPFQGGCRAQKRTWPARGRRLALVASNGNPPFKGELPFRNDFSVQK